MLSESLSNTNSRSGEEGWRILKGSFSHPIHTNEQVYGEEVRCEKMGCNSRPWRGTLRFQNCNADPFCCTPVRSWPKEVEVGRSCISREYLLGHRAPTVESKRGNLQERVIEVTWPTPNVVAAMDSQLPATEKRSSEASSSANEWASLGSLEQNAEALYTGVP